MQEQFLEIRETNKMGKGVFAKRNIPIGRMLLAVEEEKFITCQRLIQHSLFFRFIKEGVNRLTLFALLMAFHENIAICHECKDPTSSMKQYIVNLPSCFDNLICWQNQELDQLNNPSLAAKIKSKKQTMKQTFELLQEQMIQHLNEVHDDSSSKTKSKRGNRKGKSEYCSQAKEQKQAILDAISKVNFSQIQKYGAAIQSRHVFFENQNDVGSQVGALISGVEMFNHSIHTKCIVERKGNSYCVFSTEQIQEGEEIFVKYGKFDADNFLESYGMLPDEEIENFDLQNARFSFKLEDKEHAIMTVQAKTRQQLICRYNLIKMSKQMKKRRKTTKNA